MLSLVLGATLLYFLVTFVLFVTWDFMLDIFYWDYEKYMCDTEMYYLLDEYYSLAE